MCRLGCIQALAVAHWMVNAFLERSIMKGVCDLFSMLHLQIYSFLHPNLGTPARPTIQRPLDPGNFSWTTRLIASSMPSSRSLGVQTCQLEVIMIFRPWRMTWHGGLLLPDGLCKLAARTVRAFTSLVCLQQIVLGADVNTIVSILITAICGI